MNAFDFEIITPDSAPATYRLRALNVPAQEGRLTVLQGHQPFVYALVPGAVRLTLEDGSEETWQVGHGTLSVERERVALLTRQATR